MDYCTRTSDISSRQRLRSANRHQLMVPRHLRSTFGRWAFSVAGPMEWNSLPHSLRDPARSTDDFRSALKTHPFVTQRDDLYIRGTIHIDYYYYYYYSARTQGGLIHGALNIQQDVHMLLFFKCARPDVVHSTPDEACSAAGSEVRRPTTMPPWDVATWW